MSFDAAEPAAPTRLVDRPVAVAAAVGSEASSAVEFSVVSDRAAFDALATEWEALFARAGRPEQAFQSFNWLWHWANHFLPDPEGRTPGARFTRLAVVTGRRDGRLVLVWPLVSERLAGLTTLSWMGAPVGQYGDVILDDVADGQALLAASWCFIVATIAPDLVRLRKVRADAVVAPLVAMVGGTVTDRQMAPFLDLASAADVASYETRYSAKARKNRRRQLRRLEERGAVGFVTHAGGARARDLARLGLTLKRVWLRERGLVSPALADERTARFLADVAEAASHPAGCRVSALTSAAEPAAIEIAFDCKGRRLVHVIVYGLKFEKVGAGNLLLEESVRRAKADGASVVDLLGPGDAYKMEWADGAVAVEDVAVALSAAGRLYDRIYLGKVRGWLKSSIAALPVAVRRTMATGYATIAAII